jgi:tRNA(Arg) A34 adenosine deaminase TadA
VSPVRSSNYPVEQHHLTLTPAGKHRRWLTRAVAETTRSQHRTPMAAIAVAGGRKIALGVNVAKNSPALTPWVRCSRHAEQNMLAMAPNLAGATVYVARRRRDGTEALARPCHSCHAILVAAGVRQVVFTIAPGVMGIERL